MLGCLFWDRLLGRFDENDVGILKWAAGVACPSCDGAPPWEAGPDASDHRHTLDLLLRHRLDGRFVARCSGGRPDWCDWGLLAGALAHAAEAEVSVRAQCDAVRELAACLPAARPVIVLKGAMAYALTGSGAALHQSADVDLLCDDVDAVRTALKGLGYRDDRGGMMVRGAIVFEALRVTRALEPDGSVVTYAYDAASQLVNEWRSNPLSLTYAYGYNTTYTYDPVGNRLFSNSSGTVMTYTYNPANQLTGTTSLYGTRTMITYDGCGNDLTEISATVATTYTWDFDNRMTSAVTTNYGGSFETYTYSADGLRQRKVNASGITNYLWEGNNIVVETNASSVSLGRYTYGPGQWGMLISLKRDFPQFYVPDPQGNTRDLVYQYSGAPADDHYIFMAFGNELGPVGPSNNPYRYNGQWGYYRDILDRMYVQARHLDAVKGRWLSEDPIGFDGGDVNLYRYVYNSPMSLLDAGGLGPTVPIVKVGSSPTKAQVDAACKALKVDVGPLGRACECAVKVIRTCDVPVQVIYLLCQAQPAGPVHEFSPGFNKGGKGGHRPTPPGPQPSGPGRRRNPPGTGPGHRKPPPPRKPPILPGPGPGFWNCVNDCVSKDFWGSVSLTYVITACVGICGGIM